MNLESLEHSSLGSMAAYLITGVVCKFNVVVVVVVVVSVRVVVVRTKKAYGEARLRRGRTSCGRVNEGMTLEAERILGGGPDGDSAAIHSGLVG